MFTRIAILKSSRSLSTAFKMANLSQQRQWIKPETANAAETKLKLYNSLTRKIEEFVPRSGRIVTWYSCGPTVYDAAHMGHARNYITTDIMRRIVEDYFGNNVVFVQNVTDIDDKIITKARKIFLWEQFLKYTEKVTFETLNSIEEAWNYYLKKNFVNFSLNDASQLESELAYAEAENNAKKAMHLRALISCRDSLQDLKIDSCLTPEKAFGFKDIYVDYLDEKIGSKVVDHNIFRNLAAFWEQKFKEDMQKLNVRPPTMITRVSEFIPQIIQFIENIYKKGLAYLVGESVYFDIGAFEAAGHDYAKLQPWNRANSEMIEEGEGSLSQAKSAKKDLADFALWKASKPGEPSWPSPWGNGRPGWHIECSVMASEILGENIDIHSGGIDLCFPHHDNEMAQSEAFFGCPQWINYFLHIGHLHIEGSKMSKSLKNFITIEEALKTSSPRHLRLMCLYQQWDKPMDFKQDRFVQIKAVETSINNFLSMMRALYMESCQGDCQKKFKSPERKLLNDFTKSRQEFHASLCDNLNTSAAMQTIEGLIRDCNAYLKEVVSDINFDLIIDICRWVCSRLELFGLDYQFSEKTGLTQSPENKLYKYGMANLLSKFRDNVRIMALNKATHSEILGLCDKFRDQDLFDFGIALEDRENGIALVKLLSQVEKKEILDRRLEENRCKSELEEEKEMQKKLEKLKLNEVLKKSKIEPKALFLNNSLYSKFDQDGIPTHIYESLDDGTKTQVEISKSKRKKLLKEYENQKKLYDKYIESENKYSTS